MKKTSLTTAPYKLIYTTLLLAIALIVISGSLIVLDNPRFKTASLLSDLKRAYYSTAFFSTATLDTISNSFGKPTEILALSEAHTIPVLVYHGITDEPDGSDINLTEQQFKDHMFALKRAGYTTITLDDLYAFAKGEKSLPPRSFMITFDDGRTDSYYNADPILSAVDYQAVMFSIAEYTEKSERPGGYYLSPEETIMMSESGRWEIGSHSNNGHEQYALNETGDMGNFFSNHLWLETEGRGETEEEFKNRITHDFDLSQKYFGDLLGKPIRYFAFPFGDLGQNQLDAREKSKDIISAATSFYDMLFYQQRPGEYFTQFTPALQKYDNDAFLVRRINMQNEWDADELLSLLQRGEEKPLPYSDTFEADHGWLHVWGDRIFENNTLSLNAGDTSGASTVLDGSQTWKDYTLTTELYSPNRTGVALLVRFQNDNNHAACNFGTNFTHVEQTYNGEKRVLKGAQQAVSIPSGWFTAEARVVGRTLICSVNGREIVRTEFLEPTLMQGGVGIKIWDSQIGKSAIKIKQLTATEVNGEE